MKYSAIQQSNIIKLCLYALIILLPIMMLLIGILLYKKIKEYKEKNKPIKVEETGKEMQSKELVAKTYSKESIYNFMEFDKVDDNMIIKGNGQTFLMAIECQGINYDLMSEVEKNSVEAGFLEFLNTLRHPIQIYIQTRTINLEESIINYKARVKVIEENLAVKKKAYQEALRKNVEMEELQRLNFEVVKQQNLYEYAKDIIYNTEMMSLNKNVLNKRYYIIIPYHPTDLASDNFAAEEIKNIAFSELYAKAQSLIRTIGSTGVVGKILNSNELLDLLYVAYNRDNSEIYGIDKAEKAGYDQLYSTAPDVFAKKLKKLDELIEEEAIRLAKEKLLQAKTKAQQEVEYKEKHLNEVISETAKEILEENKEYVGKEIAESAIEILEEENKKKKEGKENGAISKKSEKGTKRKYTKR